MLKLLTKNNNTTEMKTDYNHTITPVVLPIYISLIKSSTRRENFVVYCIFLFSDNMSVCSFQIVHIYCFIQKQFFQKYYKDKQNEKIYTTCHVSNATTNMIYRIDE